MGTPAYSNYAPSMGYPTPAHEPAYMTPAHQPYQTPQHESSFPAPPASNLTPVEQASLTEQWVNQVQTDPSMMSPPHAPLMSPQHPAQSIPPQDDSPYLAIKHKDWITAGGNRIIKRLKLQKCQKRRRRKNLMRKMIMRKRIGKQEGKMTCRKMKPSRNLKIVFSTSVLNS